MVMGGYLLFNTRGRVLEEQYTTRNSLWIQKVNQAQETQDCTEADSTESIIRQ